jgi:uncharacterized surface protein with fasciclin (FAS1) repeats
MGQRRNAAGAVAGSIPKPAVGSRDTSSPTRSLIERMKEAGTFSVFMEGLEATGLIDRLRGYSSFTVFAPTDAAFEKLVPGAFKSLLRDAAKHKAVLSYHIIAGHIEARHLAAGRLATLQGSTLNIETPASEVRVNHALVTRLDLIAWNGVVHEIDTVILPTCWRLVAAA